MALAVAEDPNTILTSAASPANLSDAGTLGTPLTGNATRVVLLGAGELGKELAIELQRLGVEVIAVGSRDAEPAMQVAHRSHVVDLLDSDALLNVLAIERPHIVVPESGVIEPSVLGEIEDGGARVVPSALTTQMTMNREILRRMLAEDSLLTPS
jgi:phosphoribosylglycinamide formyltransferase 2